MAQDRTGGLQKQQITGQPTAELITGLLHAGDQAAWISAALALALPDDGAGAGGPPSDLRDAAVVLLHGLGIDLSDIEPADRAALGAQASAPLHQTAALAAGRALSWSDQPDEALLAQGRMSARSVAVFYDSVLPLLAGLGEALAERDALMLDVGTGVGALALAYAERFPALHVVGIDVLPRVLALATHAAQSHAAGARVHWRLQDVRELAEVRRYALAWVPAPFLAESVLRSGLVRVARALRPGGWILLAHGRFDGDPTAAAVTRFKTVAYGGTALDHSQADAVLREIGFVDIVRAPAMAGFPTMSAARVPPR